MKKRYIRLLLQLMSLSVFCFINTRAQNAADNKLIVRGRVVDKKDKSPIAHVSVAETDADGRTVRGVTTDLDGNYALRVANGRDKIVFSYIGYGSVTEDIKGRSTINVSLEQVSNQISEVTVVAGKKTDNGLLSISDRELTLAASKISGKDLEELSAPSIDQALQGRLSGVDITATSGDPGAGMSIRIRGTSSINAGSDPLIVVDGMPYETAIPSDFNFGTADDQGYASLLNIAPSDILEITVLKDAAATAMWGARAANGVLIITTKRGKVSKPVITYNLRTVIQKQPNTIPMLNGNQYSSLIPEEYMNATGTPLNTLNVKEFAYDPNDPYYYKNYGQNTDWIGAITQTGFIQDHNISMTGGGEKARYFASVGYLNQTGTTIGTSESRITSRINLDYFVSERIRFRTDIAYTYTDNPRSYTPGSAAQEIRNVALNKMPNMSIYEYNQQGILTSNFFSPAQNIQGQYPYTYNPVAMAKTASNRIIGNRVTPHFNLQYEIIPHQLILTSDIQFDVNNTKNKTFLPQIATGRPVTETVVNRAYDGDVDVYNVQSKTNLVFIPTLPKDHSLTSLISFQTYDNKGISQQALTSNTASSLLQDPSVPSRTQNTELNVGAGYYQTRSYGLLANAQYGYKQRYIINVGLRGDANSRFGPSTRYGLFPSVSTRWRMIDENFMKPLKKLFSDLSFRASYGQAGNVPRTDYLFYNNYNTFNWTYQGQSAVYPSTMELSNLKWEVIHGTNIGMNAILWNNRVNIDMEVYRNRTKDMLFNNLQIPTFNGYSSLTMNVGTMDNQGWELNIMTTPIKTKDIIVDFNFNISHNENLIRSISPYYPQQNGNITANGQYLTFLQPNNPFGSIYGFRYKGVYKDAAATIAKDAKGAPIYGPNGQPVQMRFNYPTTDYLFQPGDAMYEDINHDGNIDYKDVVYLGNSNPALTGGFGPTITIKRNLKISAFFNYRTKYDVVNGTKMTTTNMYGFNNQSTAVLRRWRNPGDITDIPRALYNRGYNWLGSDRYVEDASFLRFRSFTVRYNIGAKALRKLKVRSLSTYFTAENLLTFTRYTGQDPEVATRGISGPFTVVTDNSTTPPVMSYTLGLSASF
ncbi:MAG: SusC/RagA family TonB-linked outer membrane protein [Bacteroidota bacterium]|nr:SusC/RagA family TonB-linked outer membrane protein [Bacteroidota bacterium]